MEFRILGHLEVLDDGTPLPLGSAKQRALLAALLIRPNQIVPTEALIEEVWGDEAPLSAGNNLQVLVSRLRKLLGHETILRRGSGYLIRVGDGELDVHRFERLRREAKAALEANDASAATLLREALDVWRGPALADFAYEPFAEAERSRLEELRLAALEDRIDADLALRRQRDLVPELERLVTEHPFRERIRAQLILALYRCGRQADALEAYRATRTMFVDELGIEPSPALRALERQVLEQDANLEPPPERLPDRRRAMSRRSVALVAALVVAAAIVGLALGHGGSDRAVSVAPRSIAVIEPASDRVVADLALPIEPSLLAGHGRSLWASAAGTNAIVRIDTEKREIAETYGVGGGPAVGLVADAGGAWVASAPARTRLLVERYEPAAVKTTRTVPVIESALLGAHRYAPLVIGGGALWVSNGETAVSKVDPRSATVVRRIVVDEGAGPIAWGAGDLWTTYTLSDSVTRIDGGRGDPRLTITLARPLTAPSARGHDRRGAIDPAALLYAFGSIWVSGHGVDAVLRLDPETNGVITQIPVGDGPGALAADANAVWVVNVDGTVTKIDPVRNAVAARIDLGARPTGLTVTDGYLWVAVGSA